MILENILDLYESPERRRKPASGNPTGSAFGKCAADLQLHRYPDVSQPEEYRPRTLWGFAEGDDVERRLREDVQAVYPDLVGGVQGLLYLDVDLTAEEVERLRPHMGAPRRDPHRVWGQIRPNFANPNPRLTGRGTLRWRAMTKGPDDFGPGFILDPVRKKLWAPIFVDFTVKLEELGGHAIVEIKAVSDGVFRRMMLGDLGYQKKAQAAGIVAASGLPFFLIAQRKHTQHRVQASYVQTGDAIRVRIVKSNRVAEEFRVEGERVLTPDGQETAFPHEIAWDVAGVWTPHDPAILTEIRERIRRVLLWRPDDAPYRERGPSFHCGKCDGVGTRICSQCKGRGTTPKTLKPCGPCGGAKTVRCEACEGQGQLAEAVLPWECSYCMVKAHCLGKPLDATGIPEAFRLETVEGKPPKWIVKREAWEKSGLVIHTPPSLRTAGAPALEVPVEQPSLV